MAICSRLGFTCEFNNKFDLFQFSGDTSSLFDTGAQVYVENVLMLIAMLGPDDIRHVKLVYVLRFVATTRSACVRQKMAQRCHIPRTIRRIFGHAFQLRNSFYGNYISK